MVTVAVTTDGCSAPSYSPSRPAAGLGRPRPRPARPQPKAATSNAQGTPAPLGRVVGDLEPGTYILDLVALDQLGTGPRPTQLPKIEISVPEGWYNGGGWVVRKAGSFSVAVMFWDVDKVYPTPCEWKGEPMVDPAPSGSLMDDGLVRLPICTPGSAVPAGPRWGRSIG